MWRLTQFLLSCAGGDHGLRAAGGGVMCTDGRGGGVTSSCARHQDSWWSRRLGCEWCYFCNRENFARHPSEHLSLLRSRWVWRHEVQDSLLCWYIVYRGQRCRQSFCSELRHSRVHHPREPLLPGHQDSKHQDSEVKGIIISALSDGKWNASKIWIKLFRFFHSHD